jgi:hypothetical protein
MANLSIVRVQVDGVTQQEATDILGQVLHRAPMEDMEPVSTVARKIALPAAAPERRIGRPPAQAGDDSIRGRILEHLARSPLSSIELTRKTGLEMNQIAPACSKLKDSALIESRNDDTDGTRRWFLKKK